MEQQLVSPSATPTTERHKVAITRFHSTQQDGGVFPSLLTGFWPGHCVRVSESIDRFRLLCGLAGTTPAS